MSGQIHTESAFEAAIERALLPQGWLAGRSANYRRDLGLDPVVLFEFIEESQPKQWAALVKVHGGVEQAKFKFAKRLAMQIDSRGTIDVLRRPVDDTGVKIRLAFFKPGHALTPELGLLYEANRLVMTRQAHAMESNPRDSLDMLLLVNGLPVATAELKNQITNQTVEHAKEQYRRDRNPKDLVFAKRTLVHFAVDQDLVFIATRLAGPDTQFLPFNQGSGGAGNAGGPGNPVTDQGYGTAYLWERVWQRDNWLDLLHRFVHEERAINKGKKTAKKGNIIFPRFHQWDLVHRLAADCATFGPGRNYLLQHSAGSGKSNSIAWTAHRLTTLHTPHSAALMDPHAIEMGLGPNDKVFHKVIVVTDRVVLDRQLQETIWQFDHTPGVVKRIDKNSQQLADALAGSTAQIIITTLQKFPVIAKAAVDLKGKRFAVIVDEAHSSQSGESAKDLKAVLGSKLGAHPEDELTVGSVDAALWDAAEAFDAALELAGDGDEAVLANMEALRESAAMRGKHDNLSFFAFTATPKHKTLELFGRRIDDPTRESGFRLEPFHLYSMRQAIEEGFILDVLTNYVTYDTYFRLANGLSGDDPEVDKGKANSALARFVSLHPSSLAQKSEIIVEHFRKVTRHQCGGQAKAMVVTRSRLHALKYMQSIEKYIAEKHYTDMHALVAFSGRVLDPTTGQEFSEPGMNRTPAGKTIPETETALRFQGDESKGFPVGDYQVLIVAEKYQTGFDEPLLHTMYVDKKLDGVKAVQTLSRLNRIIPGVKEGTFVLDFANAAADIADSFKPFYEVSWSEPTDPNVLYNMQARIMGAAIIDEAEMSDLVTALLEGSPDSNETLNAKTNMAVARYHAVEDHDAKEAFRSAVRDFVRMYAFLGQVVPFTSPELERLFYYCKVLSPRLKKDGEGDPSLDLGSAAVLTHIRTEAGAVQNVSLATGEGAGVQGFRGSGHGVEHLPDKVRLSALIAMLNTKFGFEFTEVDALLWNQQFEAAARREELREVAAANTEENFGIVFDEHFADSVIERQAGNDEMFRMFFDKPEFREALTAWARRETYKKIQDSLDAAL